MGAAMPHRLGKWRSEREKNGILHLIPQEDSGEHAQNSCACKPEIDFVPISATEEVCIVTHQSFDHREDRFRNNE